MLIYSRKKKLYNDVNKFYVIVVKNLSIFKIMVDHEDWKILEN